MASVHKVKRKSREGRSRHAWQVRYRDPGHRLRSRTFTRKAEAERFANKVETSKAEGSYVDPRGGRVTFAEWALRWDKANPARKPTTADARTRLLALYVLPAFGSKQLASIRPIDVQEFVAGLEERGLSASRVRNAYFVFKPCIEAAVTSGFIARTPCIGIKLPRSIPREMSFLSVEQVRAVAGSAPERDQCLIYVLALGGLRWGEAVALRRGRLNLLRGRVEVREAVSEVNGCLYYGEPKSYEHRSVVLPRFVVEMLAQHMAGVGAHPRSLVFTSPEGDALRSPNWRRRVWAPALQTAGLPATVRIHDLRHTAAALLIAQGAHPKAIQAHLGHASITTTLDRYGHIFPDSQDEIAAALDARFAQ